MDIGKRLIVDKGNGQIIFMFDEMTGSGAIPRQDISELVVVDLEYGKYHNEFNRLRDGLNSVRVVDIENKLLEFDLSPPILTQEQQEIEELQNKLLIAQGVI